MFRDYLKAIINSLRDQQFVSTKNGNYRRDKVLEARLNEYAKHLDSLEKIYVLEKEKTSAWHECNHVDEFLNMLKNAVSFSISTNKVAMVNIDKIQSIIDIMEKRATMTRDVLHEITDELNSIKIPSIIA